MSDSIEITVDEAAARLAGDDAQLVDVRRQEEWDGSRLAGAIHIELELLASKAKAIDKDKPVIFYCHSGTRSRMAAEAFRNSGYDAYTLTGGIKAWDGSGKPLDPPGATIVH
ncbi:MAG TPA: rhodanese-like domain-containing protein [Baekduia sp.]|nr:rhodanese-like domain-containing protein [Baekduia sp.]